MCNYAQCCRDTHRIKLERNPRSLTRAQIANVEHALTDSNIIIAQQINRKRRSRDRLARNVFHSYLGNKTFLSSIFADLLELPKSQLKRGFVRIGPEHYQAELGFWLRLRSTGGKSR